MIVAEKKRKENICEYLLYMWQVEDLIRAADCKPERVEELIVSRYRTDEETMRRIRRWYTELIDMMLIEGKKEKGHLDINRVLAMQLEELHRELLKSSAQGLYQSVYYKTLPAIVQLRSKGAAAENEGEVETALNALYGAVTMRLAGKSLGEDTLASLKQISTMLAMLADAYNKKDRENTEDEADL